MKEYKLADVLWPMFFALFIETQIVIKLPRISGLRLAGFFKSISMTNFSERRNV